MVSVEVFKSRQACPCGKGESEQIGFSCDPGVEHLMICPDCKEKYSYDPTGVCRNRKVKMRPRGWVRTGTYDHSGTIVGPN
jgi:hypothetical protein